MSSHSASVFTNSCLKTPRNCKSLNSSPIIYDKKYINEIKNKVQKLNLNGANLCGKNLQNNQLKSFLEFYDSIPEYDDVNHLSNKDFYDKINKLKEKQKEFFALLKNESSTPSTSPPAPQPSLPHQPPPILISDRTIDDELLKNSSKDEKKIKSTSRRSVRIEEDFKTKILSSPSWDDLSDDNNIELETKSAPPSPRKSKNINTITIPKPFEMTVRDEENKIIDELLINDTPKKSEKFEHFKAHPVPVESQILLFHKIMADQERKNHIVRERSKAQLQSQMCPFSFTKRDEEIQKFRREFSKSSPEIFNLPMTPVKTKKFKAKPIPKNLFSNYIYKKMHEDEFYRSLQKKIRAEEMLRASSLPPSMAKREQTTRKYDVCPRTYRDMENFRLEKYRNELLYDNKKKIRKKNRSLSSTCTTTSTSSRQFPTPVDLNRTNLAALLRIQSAKDKIQQELYRKLEENKLKHEARWKEKIMRKKPVWQTLAYSHEEDLAIRLQMRREEEKLRNEKYKLNMKMMFGRVQQQPTLFERQSCWQYPMVEMKDEAVQAFSDEELDFLK